jgi:hypothetical protein
MLYICGGNLTPCSDRQFGRRQHCSGLSPPLQFSPCGVGLVFLGWLLFLCSSVADELLWLEDARAKVNQSAYTIVASRRSFKACATAKVGKHGMTQATAVAQTRILYQGMPMMRVRVAEPIGSQDITMADGRAGCFGFRQAAGPHFHYWSFSIKSPRLARCCCLGHSLVAHQLASIYVYNSDLTVAATWGPSGGEASKFHVRLVIVVWDLVCWLVFSGDQSMCVWC